MINYHPSRQTLVQFAEGLLPPTDALVVSAHCDMCPKCEAIVKYHTETTAEAVLETKGAEEFDFGGMFEKIVNLDVNVAPKRREVSETIELDGRNFVLPKSLNHISTKMGNWSRIIGKVWQAPVDIGGEHVANFIYMENGGSVPEHTHRGSETTLVINGEFSDGLAEYDSGDFIQLSDTHTHAPGTNSKEGCLVFSVISEPLHFTSGWARLINPFSHLFFK